MDTQHVELLGRNLLVGELLRSDLEVALPMRDRGVDLVVYADLSKKVKSFAAVPIQLKASTARSFSVDKKYERISNLLLVHVWHVNDGQEPVFYALRYPEAVKVLEQMGYADTPSWGRGGYSTSNPSRKLCEKLAPYKMDQSQWWEKIVGEFSK